eukprot:g74.t1
MSEDSFPLDISYSEICQWLTNRRKLSSDWIKNLKALQRRSETAFKELPFAFSSQFNRTESGQVEFLTAQSIRDQLSETSERGYFGGLSGAAGVWDKIIRSYERGNLHLGEAGQRLIQNVDFEIPYLKKQMETLDKKAVELNRLKTEYENNAVSSDSAFINECHRFEINGLNLEHEVKGLSDRVYEFVETGIQRLQKTETETVLLFYRSMNEHLHQTGQNALSTVESIIQGTVERPEPELMQERNKKESGSSPVEIPIESKEPVQESSEINWDLPEIEATEQVEWTGDADDGIDWNFEVEIENLGTEEQTSTSLTGNPSTSVNEKINENKNEKEISIDDVPASVLRFVWDKVFRNKLLDDLYEIQAFLKIRSLADPTDAILLNFSDTLFKFDHTQIQSYISHITEAIQTLSGENTQKYLLMKTSSNYSESFLEELKKKSNKPKEWRKAVVKTEQERNSVQTELTQTAVKLGQLARQTKELKVLVENGISPLFNNRKINIMGKINTVLQTYCK